MVILNVSSPVHKVFFAPSGVSFKMFSLSLIFLCVFILLRIYWLWVCLFFFFLGLFWSMCLCFHQIWKSVSHYFFTCIFLKSLLFLLHCFPGTLVICIMLDYLIIIFRSLIFLVLFLSLSASTYFVLYFTVFPPSVSNTLRWFIYLCKYYIYLYTLFCISKSFIFIYPFESLIIFIISILKVLIYWFHQFFPFRVFWLVFLLVIGLVFLFVNLVVYYWILNIVIFCCWVAGFCCLLDC